jgi:23S rRNA (adenine2503-C2)-methyltransferase
MRTELDISIRSHFFDLSAQQFDALVQGWGWPRFRAGQIREWVYQKLIADPDQMTNLAKRDRAFLHERVAFATATTAANQLSSDGTRKLLLTWPDGAQAETVMIPDADRRTACVSSQVGCPVGCKFCASGLNGVKGNLTPGQIVEQIYHLNVFMQQGGDSVGRITNVVFMGMGEPLANYGGRRITISSVGVPPKMRELAREGLPINLAISLHAPNEPLRKQLIPWAEHFPLNEILDAARFYFDETGREITLEYILLAGVNDQAQHAQELVKLCRTLRANVNLIRYNEVATLPFGRPEAQDVVRFQEILRGGGINAHVRKSRGRDIDAACGQLRRKSDQAASPLVQLGTSA